MSAQRRRLGAFGAATPCKGRELCRAREGREAAVLEESDGAQCVFLDGYVNRGAAG